MSRPRALKRPLNRPRGMALAGLTLLAIFVLMAVIGPYIAPYNPSATSTDILAGPSAQHLLGTTQTGQDVLSQLLAGSRATLLVGLIAGLIATSLAIIVGLAGGYLGGLADEGLSLLSNVFLVLPTLPLIIVLSGYLKNSSALSVAVVISVTGWAFGARILRAQTLSIAQRDFIKAARARGENLPRIILLEIMPNELGIVASSFLLTVVFAILTAASLAFLGLGSLSAWSWGTMLYWAQNAEAFTIGAWWWYAPPGICIALVGTALGLLNFSLDKRLNPRLRDGGVR
jgi:peptide/nickel transport system permease protein